MRLTKIKLAGFKSFVDPTVLRLPSNLVGIVGPNGCGKSNIIDAVRWVMGEISARHLRGDSMADVIFNGSASRKPVGQASVEMVFDNSQGRLGGPWAEYSEIAVRRVVGRDGESSYFLNGARCRRRDITDIFLGTGLGSRSYAIIEQGMIARIVEAKPEDLRVFFEEAAGISKYKERRRETESRIRHTRENLDRLNDLREELAKQLQHLQRQAQAAEKYKKYREEERRLKAELLALRWRLLDGEMSVRQAELTGRETGLEALMAEQRRREARLTADRERQAELSDALHQAQQDFYQVGAEISRIEQQLAHQEELRRRRQEELAQVERSLGEIADQLRTDEQRLGELEAVRREAEPALAAAQAEAAAADTRLAGAEAPMRSWQADWEVFSQRASEAQRRAEVERTRIEHLERQSLEQERRLERLRLEQDGLADARLEEEWEALQWAEEDAAAALVQAQDELAEWDAAIAEQRDAQRRLTAELHAVRESIQTCRGRLASLDLLQETALGRRQRAVIEWLQDQGLEQAPRLLERLAVEPGWEQAAETALGLHLEAVCVDSLEMVGAALTVLPQGNLSLFETTAAAGQPAPDQAILDKIQAPWPLHSLLGSVRAAADLEEALARRGELAEQESWITPDGVWLGRRWLRLSRRPEDGVLIREREIQSLTVALAGESAALQQGEADLEQTRTRLQELEGDRGARQTEVHEEHRRHARLQEQRKALAVRREQWAVRRGAVQEERQELLWQANQDREALSESRLRLEEAMASMADLVEEREQLLGERNRLQAALEDCRAQAAAARGQVQQQALAAAAGQVSLDATRQALARLQTQQNRLLERQAALTAEPAGGDDPVLQAQLEEQLERRLRAEEQLAGTRRTVAEQEAALRDLERSRQAAERQVQEQREVLEAQRLAITEISVRRQTLADQLGELGVELAGVLAELPADADENRWQERLDRQAARIQRLGAINLAAIDEFAQLSERQRYLDAQNEDLVAALTTLENAIRKIDRETRSRFRDTFERVNQGLQALFPRLFGGGQAYLELTGDDVLEAGVTIMAQPPGKRIGNIHLLSGGEKALTAVALVFAIFQLNPAPFCLLDEVDAPLDDANVGRFGDLLQEMSAQVQFIFITHNKITMETARHLSGVTMHEPGVSRLVAVDVDEALRLAAA